MLTEALIGGLLAAGTLLPLAWKWQLGIARATAAVAALALAATAVSWALDGPVPTVIMVWALTVLGALAVLTYRFYRDPERTPPDGAGRVVSPADGEVVYVRRSENGRLPVANKSGRAYTLEELTKTHLHQQDAVVIGIALSFLDVHVNRAPAGGLVRTHHHHPGKFASLRRLESVFENERATIVIDHEGLHYAVVLIASRLVRRIVSFVREGQTIERGQRIGVIRFGSQVDLVLPDLDGLVIHVGPGDRVAAGESVVGGAHPKRRYARSLAIHAGRTLVQWRRLGVKRRESSADLLRR